MIFLDVVSDHGNGMTCGSDIVGNTKAAFQVKVNYCAGELYGILVHL